jgi:hypothetical protein
MNERVAKELRIHEKWTPVLTQKDLYGRAAGYIERLERAIAEMRGLLEAMRMEHYHCGDSWYCCGKCTNADHGELSTNPEHEAGVCNCRADGVNAKIDAIVKKLREAVANE